MFTFPFESKFEVMIEVLVVSSILRGILPLSYKVPITGLYLKIVVNHLIGHKEW